MDNNEVNEISKEFNESIDNFIEQYRQEEQNDPSMVKIRQISNEVYQKASNVVLGQNVEKYEDKKINEELDELLNTVTETNKGEAQMLVSEALLDIMLVNDPESKITSLRIGHLIEDLRRNKKEEEIPDKFLPAGTVVLLKDATKRLMVTGFCIIEDENQEKVWDYSGCLYPEGNMEANKNYLFDHNQIEKIYHFGLVDEEETQFKIALKNALEQQ